MPPTRLRAPLRLLPFAALLAALGTFAVLSAADPAVPAQPKSKETLVGGRPLFADWPANQKPDAAIVFTGQTYGMLQPCGCSRPQTGGLERRAQFITGLRDKGWPVAGIDLGDLYPEKVAVRDQARLKYTATMNALRDMGYVAVGVGQTDLTGGLDSLLGAYALQKEQPPYILAGNAVGLGAPGADGAPKIIPRLERFPTPPGATRPLVGSAEVVEVGGVPVGVAGVVGTPLALAARQAKLDTSVDFGPVGDALKAAAKELESHKQKPR
ncbi:MAG: hypothetical protein ACKODX_11715, partial [Gemmata sp.]